MEKDASDSHVPLQSGGRRNFRHTEIFWKPWQAADYLRIPIDVVYKLIERQEIAADQRDGTWYIRKSVLDAWLDKPATAEELDDLKRLIDSTTPGGETGATPPS
jgi:excisionase family DNA binding protein